jgi:hypothetical protein
VEENGKRQKQIPTGWQTKGQAIAKAKASRSNSRGNDNGKGEIQDLSTALLTMRL